MEFFAVKKLGKLHPFGSEDADLLKKMKEGEAYRVKVSMPRNIKFHKKYFVLLNITFNNLPEEMPICTPDGKRIEIKTIDSLLWHIKMQAGHYEERMTLGGRKILEAKSIAFHRMDAPEFEEFYNRSIDVILKYFLIGTGKQDLAAEVAASF